MHIKDSVHIADCYTSGTGLAIVPLTQHSTTQWHGWFWHGPPCQEHATGALP